MFLAHRMRTQGTNKGSTSSQIIKIAIISIALGIVTMLIAVATGLGLKEEIKNKTVVFTGDLNITPFENNNSKISIRPIQLSELNEKYWNDKESIKHIQRVVSKAALVKSKTDFEGVIVKGVGVDYNWENLSSYMVSGRFPNTKDSLTSEILLTETLSKRLNVGVGDRITAYFQSASKTGTPNTRVFKIVGLYETGFPDFDSTYLLGDIRHIQRINRWSADEVGGFEVFLKKGANVEQQNLKIYNALPPHIDVISVDQIFPGLFEWISLFDFNIAVILFLMILVAVLNMTTALLILILERAKMIGLLKSMGAKNTLIQKVFLWNAIYIIFKGLVIGNVIGLGLLFGQQKFNWITLDPITYYVSEVPILLSLPNFLILNIGIVIICLFLLWIPSFVVSKIDPSKIMRVQ